MAITEMDPEVVWRLVEGYPDEITPAFKAREAFYRQFSCPRCKGPLEKEFDARVCFDGEEVLPKALLRCRSCSYCIDPHTNMVVSFGNASKTPAAFSPLVLPDQYE